jgi:hypothetical protein
MEIYCLNYFEKAQDILMIFISLIAPYKIGLKFAFC